MRILTNVTVGDQYTDAATIQNVIASNGGYFLVANNDVFMELQYNIQGQLHWTQEIHVPTGSGQIYPGTTGIRFRNFVAGSAAILSAALSEQQEPAISIGASGVANTGSGSAVTELGYAENAVPFVLAAADAAIITLPPITVNGLTKIKLEFWAPNIQTAGGNLPVLSFYDGGVRLANFYDENNTSGIGTIYGARIYTPTAGNHTWSAQGREAGGVGAIVGRSSSGAGVFPMWMRCTSGS